MKLLSLKCLWILIKVNASHGYMQVLVNLKENSFAFIQLTENVYAHSFLTKYYFNGTLYRLWSSSICFLQPHLSSYFGVPEILKAVSRPFYTLTKHNSFNLFSTAERANKFKHFYFKNSAFAYLHNYCVWHTCIICHLYWSHEKAHLFKDIWVCHLLMFQLFRICLRIMC